MIHVDESEPTEDTPPPFEYRDVQLKRGVSVREKYLLLEEIGRGKFGRVFKCKDEEHGLVLAAKVVTVQQRDERRNVEREIDIMRQLHHPLIIQLYDALEDMKNWEMCLILEMVDGGELFDRVIEDEFILTEKACSIFVRQICEAVRYIHSKNIVHLDMKPENVMCTSRTGNRIKIIDFGLARFYDCSKKLQVLFGTPEFVAPEVVNFEEISYATDMWSIGVITYVLVSGLSPFMGDNDVETMANVTIANYDFEDECFADVSDEAKDFILQLLRKDKSERMTAEMCLEHPWLSGRLKKESTPESDVGSLELQLIEDTELADFKCDTEPNEISSNSVTPDSMLSTSSIETLPVPFNFDRKRPSLDISKDNLKDFVSRYSDNPYLFDSPRGVISHIHSEGSEKCSQNSQNGSTVHPESSESSKPCNSLNLVHQIRTYSKQLHDEIFIKQQQPCHNLDCKASYRKNSRGDVVSLNAH